MSERICSVYIDPQTALEWQDVASERSADAMVLHKGNRRLAAVYMLGFVVECYAKALCSARKKGVPKSTGGHDIIAILDRAGISRTFLPV
jgi:hypothetical protein